MEEERARMIVTFKESLTTAINPADIRRYNNRLELLKNRIKEQQERIVEAEAAAELRRLELVEAMKERKMLEAVKEKSYETYLEEEKRAEQRVVDEIVSYQYAEKEFEREAVNG
jgi:flagellar FliJ protein